MCGELDVDRTLGFYKSVEMRKEKKSSRDVY